MNFTPNHGRRERATGSKSAFWSLPERAECSHEIPVFRRWIAGQYRWRRLTIALRRMRIVLFE
jgi:hypothetical protein